MTFRYFNFLLLTFSIFCICNPSRLMGQPMPRENVIDVPAIADELCVSNLFQSNMVLQRDKPIHVWGWAEAGEEVSVEFAGQQVTATADKDRRWIVTLDALAANRRPQTMTVSGKSND
ncbi:MAG: hypothetical protein AAGI63_14830, partial [Planctomycetota bacterium]